MCVTTGPAIITGTRTYVYATDLGDGSGPLHVCGYQNEARNLGDGANVMLLHYPGSELKLVRGPERTKTLMADMTARLPELVYVPRSRSAGMFSSRGITVEQYGDYTVVLSQGPGDILAVLESSPEIPENHRPVITDGLRQLVAFYMERFPQHSFVLACFDTEARPKHPIVVSYKPHDETVLTAPGLDGHTGELPVIGQPMRREFTVAFGIRSQQLPHTVHYQDAVNSVWAPDSVAGFVDNREDGPNDDYRAPLDALRAGHTGAELVAQLRR